MAESVPAPEESVPPAPSEPTAAPSAPDFSTREGIDSFIPSNRAEAQAKIDAYLAIDKAERPAKLIEYNRQNGHPLTQDTGLEMLGDAEHKMDSVYLGYEANGVKIPPAALSKSGDAIRAKAAQYGMEVTPDDDF